MYRSIASAVVMSSLISISLCAQLSDKQIVSNAFPAALNDGDGVRFSRFIAVDLNGTGQPLLVAVYTNGAGGAIRVLNRAGQVVSAPDFPGMRGFHASLQAVDLDHDGTPEIIAEFTTGHSPDNPDTWVFRWLAGTLKLISPTCKTGGLTLTCLDHVSFMDLAGDGTLALLNWPAVTLDRETGEVSRSEPWTIYTLKNGSFLQADGAFLFAHEFRRGTATPFTSEETFRAPVGGTTIRVINGTADQAATSGRITLNGKEIMGPADFQRGAHTTDIPVELVENNTVTVQLQGKPGAKIVMLVKVAAAP
jgi:hypothetical protein